MSCGAEPTAGARDGSRAALWGAGASRAEVAVHYVGFTVAELLDMLVIDDDDPPPDPEPEGTAGGGTSRKRSRK